MKKLLASALALSVVVSASAVFAGGPVIIAEEGNPEVIAEKPASSIGLLPLLLIPIILCVAVCGGDDEDPVKK
jgi:hypothetical protein